LTKSVVTPSPSATRRHVTTRWLISTWLPAVIGILAIVCESTEAMGAANTSRILRPIFQWLFGPISDASWDTFHHFIRKSGHFIGYGTLSLLFLRGWFRTLILRGYDILSSLKPRAVALALLSTFIIASCDEYHQTFLPGRTGLFSDVLLDTAGGVIFHLALWTVLGLRRKLFAAT
jgi:VanZ family protein